MENEKVMENEFDILRDCRKAMKVSQAEVASKVGVSRQMVNLWEKGTYLPTVEHYEVWKKVILSLIKEGR